MGFAAAGHLPACGSVADRSGEVFLKGFSYLKGVATLVLDRELCVGCGLCAEICPHQLFRIKNGKAEITAVDLCMECGACALNCPVKAISVEAGVGCASGMINEWLASLRFKRRVSGGCC